MGGGGGGGGSADGRRGLYHLKLYVGESRIWVLDDRRRGCRSVFWQTRRTLPLATKVRVGVCVLQRMPSCALKDQSGNVQGNVSGGRGSLTDDNRVACLD